MEATELNYTKRTWLSQRGESAEINLDSKRDGLRIAIRRWLEDGEQGQKGEATVRLIEGDGRTPDFQVHHEDALPAGHTDEDLDWAMERCEMRAKVVKA